MSTDEEERQKPLKRRKSAHALNSSLAIQEWSKLVESEHVPAQYLDSFVSAIFQIGLTHSSPKVLLEGMPKLPLLNKEHVKSRLQKFRSRRHLNDSIACCRDIILSSLLEEGTDESKQTLSEQAASESDSAVEEPMHDV